MLPADLDAVSYCMADTLRKAARAVSQHYDRHLRPVGLRVSQFAVLATVARLQAPLQAPVILTDLADALRLDRTSLTRSLAPLERDGFVHSTTGPDRRTRLILLTEAGRRKLAEALPRWRDAHRTVVEAVGEPRWRTLHADLNEIAALAG